MKSFTHMVVLGRQPELGLIELESVLGGDNLQPWGRQVALVGAAVEAGALGSAVKVARLIGCITAADLQAVVAWPELVAELTRERPDAKMRFGVSVYGRLVPSAQLLAAGLTLKRRLVNEAGVRSRLIEPKAGAIELNAAQLKFHGLLDAGFELIVAWQGEEAWLALTTTGQDVDWYSRRDYDRPVRSAKVGMLPPKLARALVNTTTAPVVVDPFCGTGVVLQEALLLGREAYGSDVADEMVAATERNLDWLAGVVSAPLPPWRVRLADARTLGLPETDLAVVSEGYLGPHLTTPPEPERLAAIQSELRVLYQAVLAQWAPQLEPGTELALCAPAWRTRSGWRDLEIVDDLEGLGYTMKVFRHVAEPVRYARPDQVVGRQLLLLRKN